MYFTKEITVPDYNWKVSLNEPTILEYETLRLAYKDLKGADMSAWDKIKPLWAKLIRKWDCTDRNEQLLPITPEGMSELPLKVTLFLALQIGKLQDDEPKNVTTSALTS